MPKSKAPVLSKSFVEISPAVLQPSGITISKSPEEKHIYLYHSQEHEQQNRNHDGFGEFYAALRVEGELIKYTGGGSDPKASGYIWKDKKPVWSGTQEELNRLCIDYKELYELQWGEGRNATEDCDPSPRF